ncbi:MarR family transcriptional regulator [Methanobrevibacter sp. OttesenSCG-928-K11]|nr:MarR family transcriptional regulator [Methanobrevibacter sp. OttesenSCG-928-K11]
MKCYKKLSEKKSSDIQLGSLISMIHRSYTVYINNSIEDLDINASQIPFLFHIQKHNNISQEELSYNFNIDKGAVARALRKMEDQNIIKRKIDDDNRRRYKLSLTEKGEIISKKIIKIIDNWENRIYNKISYLSKEELHEILKQIAIESMECSDNITNKEKEDNNE